MPPLRGVAKAVAGIAPQRRIPAFVSHSFVSWYDYGMFRLARHHLQQIMKALRSEIQLVCRLLCSNRAAHRCSAMSCLVCSHTIPMRYGSVGRPSC